MAGATPNAIELLEVTSHYGDALALESVSLAVPQGAIVSIIGANGAGKTTVLRVMSGVIAPTRGAIFVGGERIAKANTSELVRRGIAHCPEGRRIFPFMTVEENLALGGYMVRDRKLIKDRQDAVFAMFPILKERAKQLGRNLSGGQQQMLAIARAYMSGPKTLLLDEPTLGLAPKIMMELADLIHKIRNDGLTVVLVEQNAEIALDISDHAYVMAHGRVQASGRPADMRDSDVVRRVYLGR